MWVTKEQQKCLHKLKSWLNGIKEKLVQRHWKAWRSVQGWILRAHWGPHGVKHKGPILRSQHKQNGHRSSSVALTYRFSHSTDFPTLGIIIWPRALSFKGINRSQYPASVNPSSLSSFDEHVTLLYILQHKFKKIYIYFHNWHVLYISSSWSIVFQSQYGLCTRESRWVVLCSWLG